MGEGRRGGRAEVPRAQEVRKVIKGIKKLKIWGKAISYSGLFKIINSLFLYIVLSSMLSSQ